MGIKISNVNDKHTHKSISVKDCENGYTGAYVCSGTKCQAEMTFVRSYEQRRFKKTIVVPSFFKLKPHQEHSESCPYNTKGQLKIIARDSDNNVIKSLENGKYEFSLQILHSPKLTPENKPSSTSTTSNNNNKSPSGKQFIKRGRAISYLNTVRQILTLRAKIEQENELSSIIKLRYQNRNIVWKNFYFDNDHYMDAYSCLAKTQSSYPVCFHGHVKEIIDKTNEFPFYKIKLHSPHPSNNEETTRLPSITINIFDHQMDIANISQNDEILVYGNCLINEVDWEYPNKNDTSKPRKYRFYNITIGAYYSEQIVLLSC